MSNEKKEKEKDLESVENDSEWDNLYDDSGKCLVDKLEKLNIESKNKYEEKDEENNLKSKQKEKEKEKSVNNKNTELEKNSKKSPQDKKIDYLKFDPKKHEDEEENWESPVYSHIIEIYDFPISFKNEDLMNAFKDNRGNQNLSLKWVDDTHCLGIFSSEVEASKALSSENALIKTRPISQASSESKKLAKRKIDYLRPYKPRPQTSSLVASKLIGASLGLSNMLSKDKLTIERNKIKQAKDQRLKEKDLKESIWNGDT